MPVFEYIARTTAGARVTGQVVGTSIESVVADLERKDLAPVSVLPHDGTTAAAHLFGRSQNDPRVSVRTLATFYRQLGDLLRSGVPILRALQLLGRAKSNPRFAEVVGRLAEDVADGEALAESMEKHPTTFPAVQIAMVRAGERGGFLEEVLHRLATFLGKQAELRSNILGTLIYPIVLVTLGTIIVGVVMVVFVPKFKAMLEGLDLPLPTRIVLATSDLLSNHLWVVLVGLAGVVFVSLWLRRQPDVRAFISRHALRVWLIGPLLRSMAVARFCRILGTMLSNGIPVLQAMDISKDAAGNQVMVDAIAKARDSVQAGDTLAEPLAESGLFEEDVIEVIRIGESANNLDDVLLSLAETIESRVDRLLSTGVRLLEPMLLLLLGVIMLFIILALVVPLVMLSASV